MIMTNIQIFIIYALLWGSLAFFAVPIIWGIIEKIVRVAQKRNVKKTGQFARRLLALTATVLGAVLCIRFAIEFYVHAAAGNSTLSFLNLEKIMNPLLHTLRTFSLDEDYAIYVSLGKETVSAIAGSDSLLVPIFVGYIAFMNVLAPIVGGAIIFDILSIIFPLIKLFFSYLAVWNTKYYFSELNDRALSLAKSICETEKTFLTKPVIIFTNVYADKENESISEMIYKAKLLGAICLPDDITNLKKNLLGYRKFILINENEAENLQALTGLASESCYRYLKKSEVYLFSQDDVYILIEEQVKNFLKGKLKKADFPTIVPVQRYRNLATNLFDDLPLYEPIINKNKDENGAVDLNVTIIGSGRIGTEMLLSTYWCGQMLDCRLNISVVSNTPREQFFGNLDRINPEISKSMTKGSDILRINKNGEYSDPYCRLRYKQANVVCDNISDMLSGIDSDGENLLNTDYYIVCLGSDEMNISIANNLRKAVGNYHLSKDDNKKTVISYAVFDPELCNVLNVERKYDYSLPKGVDIYMHAFGSLDEMYSARNVFIKELELKDKSVVGSSRSAYKMKRRETHKKRSDDNYAYWSHLARNRHIIYKIFSAGLYTLSVFDVDSVDDERYKNDRANAVEKYKKLIYGENHDIDLMHDLAWLEHRRWCAFLRTRGFTTTKDYIKYYDKYSSHKNMDLKLHPCLVESKKTGINATFDKIGNVKEQLLFTDEGKKTADFLDEVSIEVRKKKPNQKDFKIYDYPVEDFRELKRKI